MSNPAPEEKTPPAPWSREWNDAVAGIVRESDELRAEVIDMRGDPNG